MAFKEKSKVLDKEAMRKTLIRIAHEIVEKNKEAKDICLIGIVKRGTYLAQRIAQTIKEITAQEVPVGLLDINLYRDDLSLASEQPVIHKTEIDFDINDKIVILVDDVLYTGRTIRCALDALIDFGRPKVIRLAVLVDRGHREIPVRADYAGKNIPTSKKESVEVHLEEVDGKDEVVIMEAEG